MMLLILQNMRHSISRLKIYFHVCTFVSAQSITSRSHNSKLSYGDSKLLGYLSNGMITEALNMLDKMPKRTDHHSRVVCWTSLITKYSNHGFVDEARMLLDIMPERNVVSYNAMVSGYVKCGRVIEGRRLFEEMKERNVVSWTLMVYGLADVGMVSEAVSLFEAMPERNVVSWNVMVDGLVKNGDVEGARCVFDRMPVKNVVSWNTVIAGYAENGRMEEAMGLFEKMGERNVVSWTTLISGLCRAGEVAKGYCLFQRIPEKNIVSWTAMISGFAWNGMYKEALLLFMEMRCRSNIAPNVETFISLAYACAGVGFHCLGKQLHLQVIVNGLAHDNIDGRLTKSLIHMYSVFGVMKWAAYIFEENSDCCDAQTCNYMISGYISLGKLEEAQYLFDKNPTRDKVAWTLMIDAYLETGNVSKANYLFNAMPEKDEIAWATLISGHVQNELFSEAICLFSQMRENGITPLVTTYASLFGAAGAVANLDQGRQLQSILLKTLSDNDLILNNSLMAMYAKCGEIDDAYKIFSNMCCRDTVSWNSMIIGFAHHGLANLALQTFQMMLDSRTEPNSVTFLGLLSACNHAGLVAQGWEIFTAMDTVHGIQPCLEHYISVTNLLGRAGKVKEAQEFTLALPCKSDHAIWGALLGVCGFESRNIETAISAAKQTLKLDPLNGPARIVLCNMYAAVGYRNEEHSLRKEMHLLGVRKMPGCSWIFLNGSVHVFMSGDKLHPEADDMLLLLHE